MKIKDYILGALVGLCFGLAGYYYLLTKFPLWSVSFYIQPGQVGQVGLVGQVGQVGQGVQSITINQLESNYAIMERLRSLGFLEDVAKSAGRPELLNMLKSQKHGGEANLEVGWARGSDLIEVKMELPSTELAKLASKAMVEVLTARHNLMMRQGISNLQLTKVRISSEISELELKKDELKKEQIKNVTSYLMLENILGSLIAFEAQINQALTEPNTRSTRLVESPSIAEKPTFPRRLPCMVLGILVGLVLTWIRLQYKLFKKS